MGPQTAHQRTCISKLEITHLKKKKAAIAIVEVTQRHTLLLREGFNGSSYVFTYAVM